MRRIALFARWPIPGRVKTRLTPVLPGELAARLYQGLLRDAFAAASAAAADERVVFWSEPSGGADFPAAAGFTMREQAGPDLGARLENAFAALCRDSGDRAVVIGTDCPLLGRDTLDQALAELDRCDVVLGPASDGGYYLIGLRAPSPALFRGMSWSTSRVLAQTLERAEQCRLRVTLLALRDDLDTAADLVRLLAFAAAPRRSGASAAAAAVAAADPATLAPHTRAVLRELGLLP